jgi:hypothetical protein
MKSNKPPKPEHRNLRIPKSLDDMIVDIQQLLHRNNSYTEALLWILIDWEKYRYLEEKKRLLELHAIQYQVLQNELERKKQ